MSEVRDQMLVTVETSARASLQGEAAEVRLGVRTPDPIGDGRR